MKVVAVSSLAAVAAATSANLVTFDGAAGTTFKFQALNDPVMGGKSTGTWTLGNGYGILDGEVVDVPSLKAPGFIKAAADGKFPDLSKFIDGSLVLKVRTTTPDYAGFRVTFVSGATSASFACAAGGSLPFSRGCFKDKFSVPAGKDFVEVKLPFSGFSDKWSSATGEQTTTCAQDKDVCPTAAKLAKIDRVEFWGEGADGKLHLEIESVSAEDAAGNREQLFSSKENLVQLAEGNKDLSILVSAVVAADLADTLSGKGPFTLFAPTNEAFNALPAGTLDSLMKPANKAQLTDILTTHVLPLEAKSTDLKSVQLVPSVEGRELLIKKDCTGVTVSTDGKDIKKVTSADNVASNGVAHVIDGVLLPPASNFGNLVQSAEGNKDLSILVSAVVAADLADTLSGKGPFTLFAPTNEGFNALPAGTLDNLMKPSNKGELVDILTYHVLPEQVLAGDLDLFQAVTTVEGKPLHVQKWGGKVKVGSSLESKDLRNVISADNIATNGVAHIIDGVLLPKASSVTV